MKIEFIKSRFPLVYEEVVKNVERFKHPSLWADKLDGDLSSAFSWASTPQGDSFWRALNSGDFAIAKDMFPNLFGEKTEVAYEAIPNGLFKK
mgnify:CR=1 FL=1